MNTGSDIVTPSSSQVLPHTSFQSQIHPQGIQELDELGEVCKTSALSEQDADTNDNSPPKFDVSPLIDESTKFANLDEKCIPVEQPETNESISREVKSPKIESSFPSIDGMHQGFHSDKKIGFAISTEPMAPSQVLSTLEDTHTK